MSVGVLNRLKELLQGELLGTSDFRGDESVKIEPKALRKTCLWLRGANDTRFDMLTDLTAVDYLGYPGRTGPRFEVVYQLYSVVLKHRVRLKVGVDDPKPSLDTVSDIWSNANWLEREVWDLYGVSFRGHPDLRRILLYEEFKGHPLRKDYPKTKRQPLVRRSQEEIAEALARRPSEGGENLLK